MKLNRDPGAQAPEQMLDDKKLLERIQENFRIAKLEYQKPFARARKLAATDDGSIWTVINAKYPEYQIMPDTNDVSYVKNNILASIYTVGKSARILATSEDDKQIVEDINIALEHIWSAVDVGYYQMEAGERAALMNLGITQVGWDNNMVVGSGSTFKKGEIVLKTIDPLKFMRDPFSKDLDTAGYCMTWDSYHDSVIRMNANYRDRFEAYLHSSNNSGYSSAAELPQITQDNTSGEFASKQGYHTIYVHWVRKGKDIMEIHTVNNEYILYKKDAIKPACFPFAMLYCNLPAGKLFGISEPAKIFQSSIAYNIMQSIALTAEYKNQRPPKFVNGQSGLNVASFTRTGNDADNTFIVNGDASKAVHYHEFPQVSAIAPQLMNNLKSDMQTVTGVDGRYTGRDTGSVITTGGVQNMLDQATLIDAPKVNNYEKYCKELTKLIIANYISNSSAGRSYIVKSKQDASIKTVTINFPKVPDDTIFDYEIAISTELPKNKARIEAMADSLMQMQMQYKGAGIDVDLIQPEEWLYMKDLPLREQMLKRMGLQRSQSYLDAVSKIVDTYTKYVTTGVDGPTAVQKTADLMKATQTPGMEQEATAQETQLQDMRKQQMQAQAGNMLNMYGTNQ